MNLIIFGPPGAGKGTQADFIVKKYNLYQLSTGELLRREMQNNTELGSKISSIINNGELVSDDVVSDLIEKFISKDAFKQKIIFDGYPRNLNQAKTLNELLGKGMANKTRPLALAADGFLVLPHRHGLLQFFE